MDVNFKNSTVLTGLIGCLLLFTLGKANAMSYLYIWHINDLIKTETDTIHLTTSHDKSLRKVERKKLIYLYSVVKAMEEVSETDAKLFIVDGGEYANAFAGRKRLSIYPEKAKILFRKKSGKKTTYIQGTTFSRHADKETTQVFNVIGINFKMLDILGTDVHMAAALIGHELAHLRLDHGAEHRDKPPSHQLDVDSSRYRRDNEREADYLGIIWAVEAGYDPEGAVRLRDNPRRKNGACRGYCITHPLSIERIIKTKSLARRLSRND